MSARLPACLLAIGVLFSMTRGGLDTLAAFTASDMASGIVRAGSWRPPAPTPCEDEDEDADDDDHRRDDEEDHTREGSSGHHEWEASAGALRASTPLVEGARQQGGAGQGGGDRADERDERGGDRGDGDDNDGGPGDPDDDECGVTKPSKSQPSLSASPVAGARTTPMPTPSASRLGPGQTSTPAPGFFWNTPAQASAPTLRVATPTPRR